MSTKGVIIGKFMPPHRGHEYLVNFASSFVDELWIFVCTLPGEAIPGTLRYSWMKELFPHAKVVHIEEVNPQANRHQQNAHTIWARAVRDRLGGNPDYVFASEEYGWNFSRELEARFIPVDPSRDQFPISGTEVRSHPFRYWHFIPEKVRPWFIKHIEIGLGELSRHQKEEILRTTAMLLQTLYVPQYEDFYQVFQGAKDHPLEPALADKAQTSMVRALSAQARFYLLRLECPGSPGMAGCTDDMPTPDLRIRAVISNQPFPELHQSGDILTIQTSSQTLPYALRDAILDTYRNLL